MGHKYAEIAFTEKVKVIQDAMGSRSSYSRRETGPVSNDKLGPDEAAFIAERDGFYIASVSETGWPYVQFRGGPKGFLRQLDERTWGYAEFRGNRQYVTKGNIAANNRVSLFLMDYANQRRLKIFGHVKVEQVSSDKVLASKLSVSTYPGHVERTVVIAVEAFDWNCPQHITPRYTELELANVLAPVNQELASLRRENKRLRAQLGKRNEGSIA
jgi:uncharacterized protein